MLICPDPEAVSLKAASICIARSKTALAAKGRFSLAVSGGTTPLRFFGLLGSAYRTEIRWDLTDIFWVDERCVPPDHRDSNYRGVRDALLRGADIPAANVHRMKGEIPPEAGARAYEMELKSCFGEEGLPVFDLVILGVGEDGHTASLFPGAPSLAERERLAVPVYVERLKSWRITLTLPLLNNASQILFLVTGRGKAGILKELLGGKGGDRYPAGLIRPSHGSLTWLIDKEATSLLKRE
jgi:6-phosphogluconolactonase